MPEISRFLGKVIRMFSGDHNPPHFHAIYGDHDASFSIDFFRNSLCLIKLAIFVREKKLRYLNLAQKLKPFNLEDIDSG